MKFKHCFAVLVAILASLLANAQSSSRTITASFDRIPLSQAIPVVEKASGYSFFYESANVDLSQKVSLDAKEISVDEAMKQMLKNTDLNYEVVNSQIVLFKGKARPKTTAKGPIVVHGSIVDNNSIPVIGVTVRNENTKNGVVSDAGGHFTIQANTGDPLTISCLGYNTTSVAARESVNIVLEESSTSLDALVVVGYGTQKKANLIGAVSQISSEEFKDRPVSNLGKALQGAIPNLNITYGSGLPGQETGLNIRGVASINGSGAPLVLIDGVEGSIDRINPNDVESVSVLKDAASAAIYGARAGFGVILITTKQSEDGRVSIAYNGRFSFSTPTTSTDFVTTGYDAALLVDEFSRSYNGTPYTQYDKNDMIALYARRDDVQEDKSRPWVTQKNGKYMYYGNFDWYNYLFDFTQPSWNHDLSISGGSKKFNYLLSGNYYTKEGIYAQNTDKYRTMSLNMKFGSEVTKWLSINGSARLFTSNYKSPGYDFEDGGNIPNYTFHALSFLVPINPDGSNVYENAVSSNKPADGFAAMVNQGTAYSQLRQTQYDTSVGATITPLEGWKIVGTFNYKRYQREKMSRSTSMTYSQAYQEYKKIDTGYFQDRLKEDNDVTQHFTYDLYSTYEKEISGHEFKILVGMNHEEYQLKKLQGSVTDLQSEVLNDINLGVGTAKTKGGISRWQILGFFSRVNYDYKGRYLVEANMRVDGSSRFPKKDRWGFFPSIALGWRISEENFFTPAKEIMNNLKLRASIGSLGNQAISDCYPYIQSLSPSLSSTYAMNGSNIYVATLGAQQSGNLTWETVITKNLGLDMGFLKGRLSFTSDFYIRDTKDMLIPGKELPAVYGMSAPNMNAGDLRTMGYELVLGWQDSFTLLRKPFNYGITATLADSKAKITKFDNPDNSLTTYIVGRDIGEIWGYHIEGLFQSDLEAAMRSVDQSYVNKHIYNGAVGEYKGLKAGDLIYADINNDGKVDQGNYTLDDHGDLQVIGNSRPRWHYSFNTHVSWYGVDISVFLQGIGRQQVYPGSNNMLFWGGYARPYGSFIPKSMIEDTWSENNPDAYFPKIRGYAAGSDTGSMKMQNDRYLQNLAYLRLKNITVGYTLPENLTRKVFINKLRVYFSGDNLATATKLKSDYLDPEQMSSDSNGRVYPFSKTYSFGIDITF